MTTRCWADREPKSNRPDSRPRRARAHADKTAEVRSRPGPPTPFGAFDSLPSLRISPAAYLCMFLLTSLPGAAQQGPKYQLILQNHSVRVFDLELPSGRQAPARDNIYDVFWIALDDTTLEIDQRGSGKKQFRMWNGDAHLLRARSVQSVVNLNRDPVRAVLVELRQHGLTGQTCGCTGEVESAICGCSGSVRLPLFWALVLGDLTLSGVTLPPSEAVEQQRNRGDTLLVAITPLALLHERNKGHEWEWVPSASTPVSLKAGEAAWIASGKHHLWNDGTTTVRFLTLEFPEMASSESP